MQDASGVHAKTRKITPARYRAIAETVLITRYSFSVAAIKDGTTNIDVNMIDGVCFVKIQESYGHTVFRRRRTFGL
jgi:hypothetical protein